MRIGRSKLWLQLAVLLLTIPGILKGCDGCWEDERIGLLQIKSSLDDGPNHPPVLGGGGRRGKKNHSDDDDCCHWDGVGCDPTTGRVTELLLWNPDYANSTTRPYLNASLLFLPFQELRVLSVQSYHILGCMENQDAGRRPRGLERLVIHDCIVDCNSSCFLETVGTVMINLVELAIGASSLISFDSIPQAFCNLKHLQVLSLNGNNLRGELPRCLSNLTSLQFLDVQRNQFSGDIAESPLRALLSLEYIDISDNQFRIPISLFPFFNHSRLRTFNGESNQEIYGDDQYDLVRRQDIPLFQLERLLLSSSNGDGGGYRFPNFLYYQTNLEGVHISNVNMKGAIGFPRWLLANNTNLEYLHLPNCSLSGHFQLPTVIHKNFYSLDISSNDFFPSPISPDICTSFPYIQFLYIYDNNFFGKIPQLSNCSTLKTLDASGNQLSGDIPKWIWNMSTLNFLDLSRNKFSGGLPSGFISPTMEEVYLSRNQLGGTLYDRDDTSSGADEIDYSSYLLGFLDLGHNRFTGKIPKWIAGLRPQLRYILLNDNQFYGEIPVGFCMENANLIDLSHNLLSGHLAYEIFLSNNTKCSEGYELVGHPDACMEFVTKTYLYTYKGELLELISGLDLSNNNFTGEIPPQIGHLDYIKVLNLSYNKFTGPIPPSIANLSEIESLDLSHNSLSGVIPSQLTELHSLSFFGVAYNNLSGMCPRKIAQFSTFDESSYQGNPFLNCTLPLVTPDPSLRPTTSAAADDDDDDGEGVFIDMESFYASGSVSYVMALLIIACVLYINSYW